MSERYNILIIPQRGESFLYGALTDNLKAGDEAWANDTVALLYMLEINGYHFIPIKAEE